MLIVASVTGAFLSSLAAKTEEDPKDKDQAKPPKQNALDGQPLRELGRASLHAAIITPE